MINNEPVIFNMATMPSRLVALRDTVNSILPQADELHIYLNNFVHVPDFLIHPKISCYLGRYHLGDLGDVGKFYKVPEQKGYIFTVDDKIIYPDDYVIRMVDTIERAHRKAVVSNHGRNFHDSKPTKSYYFDTAQNFMYTLTYPLTFVHEIGTGVMAYHSDTVAASLSWFPYTNMTDIWFSLECQRRKIPLIIHPHDKGWLLMGTKHSESISIHAFCNRNDQFQTKVINDNKWHINTCPIDGGTAPEAPQEKHVISFDGLECDYRVTDNRLAIVLPVLNNLHFTRKIVKALYEMRTPFFLILIDDECSDGTYEYAQSLIRRGNKLIYRRHISNKGVNASWNEGIRIARCLGAQHIAILNNDLELLPSWEQWMLKMLEDKTVGVVSPYSTYGNELPDKWPCLGSTNPLGFDILGCCFMFRSDLIDKIGYIPAGLHTYYGDNWFSHAAHQAGLQVKYCAESLIHHYYQQTTGKMQLKPTLLADTRAWKQIINTPK